MAPNQVSRAGPKLLPGVAGNAGGADSRGRANLAIGSRLAYQHKYSLLVGFGGRSHSGLASEATARCSRIAGQRLLITSSIGTRLKHVKYFLTVSRKASRPNP